MNNLLGQLKQRILDPIYDDVVWSWHEGRYFFMRGFEMANNKGHSLTKKKLKEILDEANKKIQEALAEQPEAKAVGEEAVLKNKSKVDLEEAYKPKTLSRRSTLIPPAAPVLSATKIDHDKMCDDGCPHDAPETDKDKDAKKYTPPPREPWARTWYKSNPHYCQSSHMTKEERFPMIFDNAKKLKPDAKRLLSFGCSTGEECQALAKRFPAAEIIGYDIDSYTVQTARKKNKNEQIFFHDELGGTGTYDLVTALMVFFCMEEPIPKDRFVTCLKKIDRHLNIGGVLMIYTSDYDPKEILGDNYEDLNVWMREHNVNKKQYYNGYYRKKGGSIIYEKLELDPTNIASND